MAGASWSSERRSREAAFYKRNKETSMGPRRGPPGGLRDLGTPDTPCCAPDCTPPASSRVESSRKRSSGIDSRKRECEVSDSECSKENVGNSNNTESGGLEQSSKRLFGKEKDQRPTKLQRASSGNHSNGGNSSRKGDETGVESVVPRVHRELRCLIPSVPLKSRRTSSYAPKWSLREKLDLLLKMGIVATTKVNESEEVHTLSICGQFAEENHLAMMQDSDRVSYYRKAMNWTGDPSSARRKLVEGRRVLEIGTGPFSLLSVNAVAAGAAHVVALEASRPSHSRAKKFVEAIGMSQKIDVIHGYSKRIPTEVFKDPQIIIHEIIGDFASQEGVADAVSDIQERTGCLPLSIPFGAETLICPASLPEPEHFLYPAHSYEGRSILSPRRILLQSVRLNTTHLLLSEGFQPFETLKFQEPMAKQMEQRKTLSFVIHKPGHMAGLLVVIKIEIYPGQFFGTFRNGETDSWYTSLVLLPEEIEVETGDNITVETLANMRNYSRVSGSKQSQKTAGKAETSILVSKPTYTFTISVFRPSFSCRKPLKAFKPIVVSFEEQAPVLSGATRKYADKR
ncbi:uncharacterized protein LOC34618912 [Cyclospora cayetanensis]|uniref:Uncharacterized protein LOC34618912 n=1 Tax=Cyclospora cayetanensis TaxID=88456 RepID=A0A6P6RPW4_9EIME|nr:uncharacterized protein LOC34618912 [Cyclospora cayetanensis]